MNKSYFIHRTAHLVVPLVKLCARSQTVVLDVLRQITLSMNVCAHNE